MNWKLPAAALLLVLAISGCTLASQQDPKTVFREISSRANHSEYHITYKMTSDAVSGLGNMFSGIQVYRDGERRKMLMSVSLLGTSTTTAQYRVGGRSVTCTEGSNLTFTGPVGVTCSLGETSKGFIGSFRDAGNYTLNMSGTMEVAGRECQLFTATPENRSQLDFGSSGSMRNVTVHMCLDRGKGYLAYASVNATSTSELASDTRKNLLTLKVTNYEAQVSEDDVALPVNVVTSLDCEDTTATLLPSSNVDRARLSFNGAPNRTVELTGRLETTDVNLSTDNRVSGINTLKVFASGEVNTATCTYYGFDSGDFDYNFSESTLNSTG